MKRIAKASISRVLALVFVAACGAGTARAQIHDARVISARAGGVNFVAGDVSTRRRGGERWEPLKTKDELSSGDEVRAGEGGRVEVLLNPGSYFRAGSGAQFTFAAPSLEDLRLELSHGSFVVEATGYSDLDLSITLAAPRSEVRIVRSGVYRVDVEPSGTAVVKVLKGRAVFGGALVKGGKVARAGASGVELAKLDKKSERDELDLWSRERGKELAKANEKLSGKGIRTTLSMALNSGFFFGNGGGLWFWNGSASCYTFLPFYANWESPYGFMYGRGYYYPYYWNGGSYYPRPVGTQPGGYTPYPGNGNGPTNPNNPTTPGNTNPGRPMPERSIDPPRPPREPSPRRDLPETVRPPGHDQL